MHQVKCFAKAWDFRRRACFRVIIVVRLAAREVGFCVLDADEAFVF